MRTPPDFSGGVLSYVEKGKPFPTMGIAACCARLMDTLAGREEFSGTHMSRQKTD